MKGTVNMGEGLRHQPRAQNNSRYSYFFSFHRCLWLQYPSMITIKAVDIKTYGAIKPDNPKKKDKENIP